MYVHVSIYMGSSAQHFLYVNPSEKEKKGKKALPDNLVMHDNISSEFVESWTLPMQLKIFTSLSFQYVH